MDGAKTAQQSLGRWPCHLTTRHKRTTPVVKKVFAIELEPRTVHWNNRLSFGTATINSAEVRRRCPRLDRTEPHLCNTKLVPQKDLVDNTGRVRLSLLAMKERAGTRAALLLLGNHCPQLLFCFWLQRPLDCNDNCLVRINEAG